MILYFRSATLRLSSHFQIPRSAMFYSLLQKTANPRKNPTIVYNTCILKIKRYNKEQYHLKLAGYYFKLLYLTVKCFSISLLIASKE